MTASISTFTDNNEDGMIDILQIASYLQIPLSPYYRNNARYSKELEILPLMQVKRIYDAVHRIHSVYDELTMIVARQTELLTSFFGFTELQQALWNLSSVNWCGLTRADVFITLDNDIKIVELNSDTPSGIDEAILFDRYVNKYYRNAGTFNNSLREEWLALVDGAMHSLKFSDSMPTVGILFPTDIPEDMGMIFMLKQWIEESGKHVVLGQPQNIELNSDDRVMMFGQPIDIIIRHFKTDWWAESTNRRYTGSTPTKSRTLYKPLANIAHALSKQKVAVINPFSTILTQNKFCMAFMYEYLHLFSTDVQSSIKRYIPYTIRANSIDLEYVESHRERWVLKSIYGCEGVDTVVGMFNSDDEWKLGLEAINPNEWIVQEYYQFGQDDTEKYTNYGVYSVGRKPSGMYVRKSVNSTDNTSMVVPVCYKKVGIDIKNATQSDKQKKQTQDSLVEYFRPSPDWLSMYEPLLLYSVLSSQVNYQKPDDSAVPYRLGRILNSMLARSNTQGLLLILDVEGVTSVEFSSQLQKTCESILHFNNIASANEAVPLSRTFSALITHKSCFGSTVNSKRRIPCLVMDSNRLHFSHETNEQVYNNRYRAILPEIDFLRLKNINDIIYIYNGNCISEDIQNDVLEYHANGIRIAIVTIAVFDSSEFMNYTTIDEFLLHFNNKINTGSTNTRSTNTAYISNSL
jgi:glutathionylspermidine synthase